jgi:ribonuclease VapC
MILDTSVLIAIIKEEPEAASFAVTMEASKELRISAANYLELSMVVDRLRNPRLSARLDEILEKAAVIIEPVTAEQAQIARQAYRDYGRGSGHRANLNFSDCFAYALARAKREPLLFQGDDFNHTDVRSAAAVLTEP